MMTLRFISLFSGIGGFDLGFERAGMQCVAQVEIDKDCREVLKRHFPDVVQYEDVCNVGRQNLPAVDLICGGFPCQDVSIAGRRAGLAGERSGLWFEFQRILMETKPRWVVIENVPGLLSSNSGRDFAIILHGLAECGYRVTWRVLDAQYFGVPQRRRRVFIVGSLGNGRSAQVLFERESSEWHPQQGKQKRKEAASETTRGASEHDRPAYAIRSSASGWKVDGADNLVTYRIQRSDAYDESEIASTLSARDYKAATDLIILSDQLNYSSKVVGTLTHGSKSGSGNKATAMIANRVRRLTPVECERLQGFPDNWTGNQSDIKRYRQLGNAVAVPVIEWIGKRIVEAENG